MAHEQVTPLDDVRNAAVMRALDAIGNRDATYKCGALKRDGAPCGNWALRGFDRCLHHGGGAPLAKAAIKKRLLQLAGAALDRLVELMSSPDDKVALAATLGLLDRAGLGPHAVVDIKERREEIERLSDEQLADRLRRSMEELTARKTRVIDITPREDTPEEEAAASEAQENLAQELAEQDETEAELARLTGDE